MYQKIVFEIHELSKRQERKTKTNRQTDKRKGGQTDRQTNRQNDTDTLKDRQTDKRKGGQTDRQTGRQRKWQMH